MFMVDLAGENTLYLSNIRVKGTGDPSKVHIKYREYEAVIDRRYLTEGSLEVHVLEGDLEKERGLALVEPLNGKIFSEENKFLAAVIDLSDQPYDELQVV